MRVLLRPGQLPHRRNGTLVICFAGWPKLDRTTWWWDSIFGATGGSFFIKKKKDDQFLRKNWLKTDTWVCQGTYPESTRPVYKDKWQKPNNTTRHTGPEAAHHSSRRPIRPSRKGRHSTRRRFRSRRSDVHAGLKTVHAIENRNTPNPTHRPRGRAPHEPTTLPPKQEVMTLHEKKIPELPLRRPCRSRDRASA
jgi:hypothetical protein